MGAEFANDFGIDLTDEELEALAEDEIAELSPEELELIAGGGLGGLPDSIPPERYPELAAFDRVLRERGFSVKGRGIRLQAYAARRGYEWDTDAAAQWCAELEQKDAARRANALR